MSRKKAAQYWEVSEYLGMEAHRLKNENGILPKPLQKYGKNSLSKHSTTCYENFYENDEKWRMECTYL